MFFKSWRPIVLVLGETSLLLAAVAAGTYLRLGEYGLTLLLTTDGFFRALPIEGCLENRIRQEALRHAGRDVKATKQVPPERFAIRRQLAHDRAAATPA